MAPMYGQPNYDWPNYDTTSEDYPDESSKVEDNNTNNLNKMTFWYMMVLIIMLITWMLIFFCLRLIANRQKTRNTQQRRAYVPGSRQRQMSVQGEPTIFVSPDNLPPPPKYDAMAPPSYEEVMGVHYPAYQPGQQPITQPLTFALAQGSSTSAETNVTRPSATEPAVITIANEQRRTSVTVRP